MASTRPTSKQLLAIAGIAFMLLPVAAKAQPAPDDGNGGCRHHGDAMASGHGIPADGPLPPFLHGLDLSDEQRDAIFSITHKLAPAMRDKEKALHTARESLRKMTASGKFGDARARELAREIADNSGAIALLMAHAERDIYATLTPQQRKQAAESRNDFHPMRDRQGNPEKPLRAL
jgi:Spy/CpxP family protein refolding chaperone